MPRPRLPQSKRKVVCSLSLTPFHWQLLDSLADRHKTSRSLMVAMLIDNGGLELGVTGQVEGHIQSKQLFKLKKSGLLACNPSTGRGFCQNDACQAAYKKEGLI